jgi:hypothetical protein
VIRRCGRACPGELVHVNVKNSAYAEIRPDEKAHRGHPLISRVNNPPGQYS